jgi:hypothetical protein
VEHAQFVRDQRLVLEEGQRLFDREIEHFGDMFAAIAYLQRLLCIARAVAGGTKLLNIR